MTQTPAKREKVLEGIIPVALPGFAPVGEVWLPLPPAVLEGEAAGGNVELTTGAVAEMETVDFPSSTVKYVA